jgi:hypothetical protein
MHVEPDLRHLLDKGKAIWCCAWVDADMSLGPSMEDLFHFGPSGSANSNHVPSQPHFRSCVSKLHDQIRPTDRNNGDTEMQDRSPEAREDDICCATCVCG